MKKLKKKLFNLLRLKQSSVNPTRRNGMDQERLPSWEREEPCLQPYYSFENGLWVQKSPCAVPPKETLPSNIRLISWNIDAMVPFGPARIARALEHLEAVYRHTPYRGSITSTTAPLIVFLQEMTKSDLKLIQEALWVREHFYITDRSCLYWEDDFYGTTTLVEKRAFIERVFRVHYGQTRFGRDALFVDIAVEPKASTAAEYRSLSATDIEMPGQPNHHPKILRICNTHLESLISNPPVRPTQLKTASKFLHPHSKGQTSFLPSPHASILAGDLNAFEPEDLLIVSSNCLRDSYLTLGGEEDTEEGYTWGMHPREPSQQNKYHPLGRLDKVLYCGGAKPEKLERVGTGLKVDVTMWRQAQQSKNGDVTDPNGKLVEQWVWVTDHLGLMASFTLVGGSNDSERVI